MEGSDTFVVIKLKKDLGIVIENANKNFYMKKLKQNLKILIPFIAIFTMHIGKANTNNPDNPTVKRFSVSGYVKDAKTGEALIGATVYIKELKSASVTNQYGFYSVNLIPGTYNIDFSYVGYETKSKSVNLKENIAFTVELSDAAQEINEVVIKSEKSSDKLKRAEMSVAKMEMKTIKKIPALMGEVDLIKAIQMLPGVQATSEGTSGFNVRGGGIDQNLIILDEATVYNASHLMGFFSVFNNDAIKDVKLYKGDIPAFYGGRLSSVLDVRMKEGNNKKFAVTGGLGLISSRLTIEGPIGNEKTSFLVSGRRTYADVFFPLSSNSDLKKTILYFYDLNAKINTQINENNRLFFSAYMGRDNFGQKGSSNAGFGNKTITTRWNHQFSSILFSNVTGIISNYDYDLEMSQGGADYVWKSNLLDYSLKTDFSLYPTPENEVKFGAQATYHSIDPCNAYIQKKDSLPQKFPDLRNYEYEYGFYVSNQQKVTENLTLKYGLRYSIFQNVGKSRQNNFDANHNYIDSTIYPKGKIFKTYDGFEPRLSLNYSLNESSSVKASYSRTIQYLQLASNSNGGMPLDYWFPSSPNVKPQKADQYAIGYLRNLKDDEYEVSVEAFYKDMYNVIDFRDHAQLLFNDRLEGDIRSGKAKSYGAEFMVQKNKGKLNGWVSYTYSRVFRKIENINDGKEYSAPYDKPHNINIILNYEISPRVTVSTNWVYASGTPITFPVGSFKVGNNVVPIYSDRNAYRMRDYHRMDISVSIKDRANSNRLWQGEWVFSLYNAYGRHNDWIINFVNSETNIEQKVAQRMYLPFVFFPGVTYNFNF